MICEASDETERKLLWALAVIKLSPAAWTGTTLNLTWIFPKDTSHTRQEAVLPSHLQNHT